MNWDVLDQNLRLESEGKVLGNGVKCFRARGGGGESDGNT